MKTLLRSAFIVVLSLLFGHLLLSKSALSYCPPYFAFVDKMRSTYPNCLRIDGKHFCGGDLEVINNCPLDVVVDGKLIPSNETEYGFYVVNWNYKSVDNKPQKWEIKGTYNNKDFIIRGQTEDWSSDPTGKEISKSLSDFSNLLVVKLLLILVALFVIVLVVFKYFLKHKKTKSSSHK